MQIFWDVMDRGAVEMGYPSIAAKAHLPYWLLWVVAWMGDVVASLLRMYVGSWVLWIA